MTISQQAQALQDAFRESTGRFGIQTHGEMAGGTDILSHQSAMPSWPEGVPEPEVSWSLQDGDVYTTVSIEGNEVRFWTNRDGDGLSDNAPWFENPWEQKYGDAEHDAMEWAREAHIRIEDSLVSLKSAIAEDPKASAAVIRAATGGLGAPEHKAPTSGEEFEAEMRRTEYLIDQAQRRKQHGNMVRVVSEVRQTCPNVASFYLYSSQDYGGWEVVTGDVHDADGNPVSVEEQTALQSAFLDRDADDFRRYLHERVNIDKVLSTWN